MASLGTRKRKIDKYKNYLEKSKFKKEWYAKESEATRSVEKLLDLLVKLEIMSAWSVERWEFRSFTQRVRGYYGDAVAKKNDDGSAGSRVPGGQTGGKGSMGDCTSSNAPAQTRNKKR